MAKKKMFYCYGQDEGDPVEVEIVDLGEKANAALKRIYQQPTNLTETGLNYQGVQHG